MGLLVILSQMSGWRPEALSATGWNRSAVRLSVRQKLTPKSHRRSLRSRPKPRPI